jgi:hypothetical protein
MAVNSGVIERRVVRRGGRGYDGSLTITLPRDWWEAHSVGKGSLVRVAVLTSGEVVVTPARPATEPASPPDAEQKCRSRRPHCPRSPRSVGFQEGSWTFWLSPTYPQQTHEADGRERAIPRPGTSRQLAKRSDCAWIPRGNSWPSSTGFLSSPNVMSIPGLWR